MIFRVYALFGRSKKILAFLLFIYAGEVVASVIDGVVYTVPGNASSMSNSSVCYMCQMEYLKIPQ